MLFRSPWKPPFVDGKARLGERIPHAEELVALEMDLAAAGALAQRRQVNQCRALEATQRADVIEVKMRRNDGHRQRGERAAAAEQQVAVIALVVAWLTDRKRRGVDVLDQEVVAVPVPLDRLARRRQHGRAVLAQQVFGAHVGRQDRQRHSHRRNGDDYER